LLAGLLNNERTKIVTKIGGSMEIEKKEKEIVVEECRESQKPAILEEINIEELAVDGICGIY
jgi:mycofactocin precursor